MYIVEKAVESCLVCQFPGCSCHHVAWGTRGWKKQEDEKQKKMKEEDFDLIVQHYLGVYIF